MASSETNQATKTNVDVVVNPATPVEIPPTPEKPKYKRPMTEKRLQAIEKMKEGRKKALERKKTKAEVHEEDLKSEITRLTERLIKLETAGTPKDLIVTKPVKVEKEDKKKETEYRTPETKKAEQELADSMLANGVEDYKPIVKKQEERPSILSLARRRK